MKSLGYRSFSGFKNQYLVEVVNKIMRKSADLTSLDDSPDMITLQSRLRFNLFAKLFKFEQDVMSRHIRSRFKSEDGLGNKSVETKVLSPKTEAIALAAETLYLEGKLGISEIAKYLQISKATLYKYLRYRNVLVETYQNKLSR